MLQGLVLVERVDGWTQGGGGGRGKVMQFPFNTLYMLYTLYTLYTLYKLLTFNF